MNLVFQVNIKPNDIKTSGRKKFTYSKELYNFSNLRAKEYANKNNSDYFCLTKTKWLGNYAPCYHKLYVYELLKRYNKVFYLDSDAIITKYCPNIFKLDDLSATKDCANTIAGNKRTIRKNEIHNLPLEHQYFCSGIILFNQRFYKKTKKYWREELTKWKDIKNAQHDQSIFNVLVGKYYGKFNVLEYDWGAHWKRGKYIVHYGNPKPKLEFSKTIERFFKYENSISPC
tara:strand:- start:49 stop:735 length:687 start_codon:yes stop_codon:yes gene_type:complete